MDEILTPPAPPVEPPADTPPDPQPEPMWPHAPPVEGRIYGFIDPTYGTRMVALTEASMLQIGTSMEALRRSVAELSLKFRDQFESYQALQRLYTDLQQRHENLRNATKASRIEAAQKQLDTPQIIVPDKLPFKSQIDRLVNDALKKQQ